MPDLSWTQASMELRVVAVSPTSVVATTTQVHRVVLIVMIRMEWDACDHRNFWYSEAMSGDNDGDLDLDEQVD